MLGWMDPGASPPQRSRTSKPANGAAGTESWREDTCTASGEFGVAVMPCSATSYPQSHTVWHLSKASALESRGSSDVARDTRHVATLLWTGASAAPEFIAPSEDPDTRRRKAAQQAPRPQRERPTKPYHCVTLPLATDTGPLRCDLLLFLL